VEAGPPLLSWNKYMHDTSSLLVMSAFFLLFCSYIHKRGVGYIYGSGLFVCMRVWYPFLFLVIGGVCFMRIPTWEQFFDSFLLLLFPQSIFVSLERKATRFFFTSLFGKVDQSL